MGEYQLAPQKAIFNTRELGIDERCDKCGHSAYFVAVHQMSPEKELRFCAHHGFERLDLMTSLGWSVKVIEFAPQADVVEPAPGPEEIVIDEGGALA